MANYKFKPGDEVIWLKPVKVKLEKGADKDWVKGKVIEDPINSDEGEWWHFYADSGIWQSGTLETNGILVHPGFTVTSGPEPKRKPTFKDREFVLVRDRKNESWKLAAFKGYNLDDDSYPYETYNSESFKYCIPYAGNEQKMGEVTED